MTELGGEADRKIDGGVSDAAPSGPDAAAAMREYWADKIAVNGQVFTLDHTRDYQPRAGSAATSGDAAAPDHKAQ